MSASLFNRCFVIGIGCLFLGSSYCFTIAQAKELIPKRFVVYPKKVKIPSKFGSFSIPPIEADEDYGKYQYPEFSGYAPITWPPFEDPKNFLEFVISVSSYEYLNENYFAAIEILSDAIDNQLYGRIEDPNFLKKSLNELVRRRSLAALQYRIHLPESEGIKILFNYRQERVVKNTAANFLGNLLNKKSYFSDSITVLQNARQPFETTFGITNYSLLSHAYIETGNYQKAIRFLTTAPNTFDDSPILVYNLGIAYLQSGEFKKGITILDELGDHSVLIEDEQTESIRDRANITLAQYFTEGELPNRATVYLNRVRDVGPYSNQAKLGLGWAHFAQQQYREAVTPWKALAKNDPNNYFVKEASFALPYGYYYLEQFNRSAQLYDKALFEYIELVKKIDAADEFVNSTSFDTLLKKQSWGTDTDTYWFTGTDKQSYDEISRLGLFDDGTFTEIAIHYSDLDKLLAQLEVKRDAIEGLKWLVTKRNNRLVHQISGINQQYDYIRRVSDYLTNRYLKLNDSDRKQLPLPAFNTALEIKELDDDYEDYYDDIMDLEEEFKEAGITDELLWVKLSSLKQIVLSQNYFSRVGKNTILEEPDSSQLDEFYEALSVLKTSVKDFLHSYSEIIASFNHYHGLIQKQDRAITILIDKLQQQQQKNKKMLMTVVNNLIKEERARLSTYTSTTYKELRKAIVRAKRKVLLAQQENDKLLKRKELQERIKKITAESVQEDAEATVVDEIQDQDTR